MSALEAGEGVFGECCKLQPDLATSVQHSVKDFSKAAISFGNDASTCTLYPLRGF